MTTDIRFGTDGWRGIIADEFTFGNLRRVATAAAELFKRESNPLILVGYDRRFFGREFAETVARVLANSGLRVLIAKESMTTPSLSVSVTKLGATWGIMMTASHNPALYNGFKVKDRHGRSAPPEVTTQIEQLLRPLSTQQAASDRSLSQFNYRQDYLSYLKSRLDWKVLGRLRGTIVLDHMHGAAAGIPEDLLAKSHIKLISMHAVRDPLFGGLHPEPIEEYLGDLKLAVKKNRAVIGLAFDGDADRLGVVDDSGHYLTPSQVFPLLAYYAAEYKGFRGQIVQAVSLGMLGQRIAQAYNVPFEEVPVGFKHVAERMLNGDVMAGGEESGGYALHGGLPERDGILSGLFLVEMIAATGKKPSVLLKQLEKRFGAARFKRRDVVLSRAILDKSVFVRAMQDRIGSRLGGAVVKEVRTNDGLKVICEDGSWLLLRPSGTEPLLRTYAESSNWAATEKLLNLGCEWVDAFLSSKEVAVR